MRIIKKGKDPNTKLFRAICYSCDAVLEAERKELKIEYDQRESGEFGRAQCPCCKCEVIFYPKS